MKNYAIEFTMNKHESAYLDWKLHNSSITMIIPIVIKKYLWQLIIEHEYYKLWFLQITKQKDRVTGLATVSKQKLNDTHRPHYSVWDIQLRLFVLCKVEVQGVFKNLYQDWQATSSKARCPSHLSVCKLSFTV